MTTPERAPRRRRRLGTAAAVAVLAALNVAWNATADVAPVAFPGSEPKPPLRLTAVRWSRADDTGTLLVEVTVRNVDARRRQGLVWWQLAPEPGAPSAPPPWPRRAYESRYLDVDLAGAAAATFRWTEEPMVPAGRYQLHAWARYAVGDSFRSSDGRPAVPTTVRVTGTPPLLRHRPPPADVVVTSVDARTGLRSVQGRVRVENLTDQPRHAWLRWTLDRADAGDVRYWWRWAGEATTPRYREVVLAPRGRAVVDLRSNPHAGPGSYALRVTVEPDDVALTGDPGELAGDDVMALVRLDGGDGAQDGGDVPGSRR